MSTSNPFSRYRSKVFYIVSIYFYRMFRTVLRHRSRRSIPEETDFDEKEHLVAAMEREFHIVNTRFVSNVLL